VVGEEEWVERQEENEGLVQCENLRRGHCSYDVCDPTLHNCCKHHGRRAKGVVRDGESVDEVARVSGDWDWNDERMKKR